MFYHFIAGTLNSYVNTLKMQTKWQMKKASGDFSPEEKRKPADQVILEHYRKQQDDTDEALAKIRAKIEAGAKLTYDEMQYLKSKDPVAYQKLKELEAEKKGYEQALRRCKTKEEVQRLKMAKVGSSLAAIRSAESNPHLTEATKLSIAMQENQRVKAIDEITTRFVKSRDYQSLPTEAEQRKAQQEIREAKETERKEGFEKLEASDGVQTGEETAKQSGRTDPAEQREMAVDPGADKKQSLTRAEDSPEAKKVRRANRQAGQHKWLAQAEEPFFPSSSFSKNI